MKVHPHTIAMLGNHLPRHCGGIATFTTDLIDARREGARLRCFVLAMNDVRPSTRIYPPPRVRFQLAEGGTSMPYRNTASL
jgi:hypothetical protein